MEAARQATAADVSRLAELYLQAGEELVAWFEARGCTGADTLALLGARATKNFFEESGFTAPLVVLYRRLRADG